MNPFQKNKVDINALTPEEQKAFRLYGKLPNRKDVMQNKLKERKYFDSGDYYLSKAGQTSEISPTDVGREHPVPENIPHLSQSSPSGSNTHPSLNLPGGPSSSAGGGGGLGGGLVGSSGAGMGGASGSPVKESSFLSRGESIDDVDEDDAADGGADAADAETRDSISPPPKREGVPVPMRGRGTAPSSAGASGLR